MIEAAVRPLLDAPEIPMGTLKTKLTSLEEFRNPNVVKVVTDRRGFALYFSRAPIPHPRDFDSQLESRWRELATANRITSYNVCYTKLLRTTLFTAMFTTRLIYDAFMSRRHVERLRITSYNVCYTKLLR